METRTASAPKTSRKKKSDKKELSIKPAARKKEAQKDLAKSYNEFGDAINYIIVAGIDKIFYRVHRPREAGLFEVSTKAPAISRCRA